MPSLLYIPVHSRVAIGVVLLGQDGPSPSLLTRYTTRMIASQRNGHAIAHGAGANGSTGRAKAVTGNLNTPNQSVSGWVSPSALSERKTRTWKPDGVQVQSMY